MSEPSPSNPSDTDPTLSPPPATGRRREGNDSLWKRARRTLGTNSLTFLQPQSRPTRSASKEASGPAPPNKRREQVRHAQRTHRQRTQNYIKTLESEVVRLRGQESTLTAERDKLKLQLETLRTTCILNNVALPLELENTASTQDQQSAAKENEMPATISYQTDEFSHPFLHIDWPSIEPSVPQNNDFSQPVDKFTSNSAIPNLPNDFVIPSIDYPSALLVQSHASRSPARQVPNQSQRRTPPSEGTAFSSVSPSSQPQRPTGKRTGQTINKTSFMDDAAVAINFVLALEQPCLPHIPHPNSSSSHAQHANTAPLTEDLGILPDADLEPSNHIQMLSAPLVQFAPQAPSVDSSWQASASVIKELLNLSKSINLDGEITPVECWWRLRSHPGFAHMGKAELENLKGLLSKQVTCCGFGAVLSEQIFLEAVAKVLEPRVKAQEQQQQAVQQQYQNQPPQGLSNQPHQAYGYGVSYA